MLFGKLKKANIESGKRCWKDGTVVGDKACGSLCLDKDDFVYHAPRKANICILGL